MVNLTKTPLEKFQQQTILRQKNEKNYSKLLNGLLFFFTIRTIIMLIIMMIIIFFFSGMQMFYKPKTIDLTVPQNTISHINHLFMEAESQNYFIAKFLKEVIQKQYKNYQKYSSNLFYKQLKYPLEYIQKQQFLEVYGTNGSYTCINNDNNTCVSVDMFLQKLWSKIINHQSFVAIYFQYLDPIENQLNTAYTPSSQNDMNEDDIKGLFKNITEDLSLIKINSDLYLTQLHKFNTSFDSDYFIKMAIKLKKQKFTSCLCVEIEFRQYYHYEIKDNFGWITVPQKKKMPILYYFTGTQQENITYTSRGDNQIQIAFTFITSKAVLYGDFMKISLILPLILFVIQIYYQKNLIKKALYRYFKPIQRLISLYEFNINQIFLGNQPKSSIVLSDTSITEFYQQLSKIPSNQYQPIKHEQPPKKKLQTFKFKQVLISVKQRYNQYAHKIFKQKNKQIINNKFFIHSSVNQLSQSQSLKIKQHFLRSKELGMIQHFFKFSYLSLLLTSTQFDQLIQSDTSPLPQQSMQLMRQINRTVSGQQVRKAFRLSQNVLKQTQQQLQMRIQINLLQKYLQCLKDLDIHGVFAQQLKLQGQIQNLNSYIQNIKHLLNKHNKNVRMLGK